MLFISVDLQSSREITTVNDEGPAACTEGNLSVEVLLIMMCHHIVLAKIMGQSVRACSSPVSSSSSRIWYTPSGSTLLVISTALMD